MSLYATADIPDTVRCIHLIAVCGTGMGALAGMLKDLGYVVTGSDQHIYPPMSDFLRAKQITVLDGFRARNLSHQPDLVVVGNAVSKDNPEVQAMISMGLPYCSMPQAINHFGAENKRQIVVTGTHGKTTTSSFIAWMLHSAGMAPSFLIGGIGANLKSNYRAGEGDWIVLEGDEYDTAYFDKGPKFLHYQPAIAVLTGIEFDHADIFKDLDHIKTAFNRFITNLPAFGTLIAFDNDENIASIVSACPVPVLYYGRKAESDWRLGETRIEPPWTRFEVYNRDHLFGRFKTRMIGEHNMCNLLSGIAAGHLAGLHGEQIVRAVETFNGVRRRQETRGVKNGITVLDDFAHHPTAVRETVRAVKGFYGQERRVIAVFEPRTNSSRRKVFQGIYPASFDDADMICIRQPPLLDKIPLDQRFSSIQLVDDLKTKGKDARFFEETDGIIEFLKSEARPDDVILIMSNGGFDNIHQRLLDVL